MVSRSEEAFDELVGKKHSFHGWPDRLIRHNSQVIAIEVKEGADPIRASQSAVAEMFSSVGWYYVVVRFFAPAKTNHPMVFNITRHQGIRNICNLPVLEPMTLKEFTDLIGLDGDILDSYQELSFASGGTLDGYRAQAVTGPIYQLKYRLLTTPRLSRIIGPSPQYSELSLEDRQKMTNEKPLTEVFWNG
jgi:hypothetical protein